MKERRGIGRREARVLAAMRGESVQIAMGIGNGPPSAPIPCVKAGKRVAFETEYNQDLGPLLLCSLMTARTSSAFFLIHKIAVGDDVALQDDKGVHADLFTVDTAHERALEPLRITKGQKLLVEVSNVDTADHPFYAAAYLTREED